MRSKGLQSLITLLALVGLSSCMSAYKKSVGGEVDQSFHQIYKTDYNTAWQAVLESLKSVPLEVANRESGHIKTKWIDNTADKNFAESFGKGTYYLKAQYRFLVDISKGFYNGKPTVKVVVRKEQLVQYDVLEGWKPVPTNSYEENTLLYRIGRIVYIQLKLARIEEERTKRELEKDQL